MDENGQFDAVATLPWPVWCCGYFTLGKELVVETLLKCVEPAFMLPLLVAGVTPGQESVNASLAGMGLCAHDPAPFTRMERDAATTAIVRTMHNVPLSTERASVQQVRISVAYTCWSQIIHFTFICDESHIFEISCFLVFSTDFKAGSFYKDGWLFPWKCGTVQIYWTANKSELCTLGDEEQIECGACLLPFGLET